MASSRRVLFEATTREDLSGPLRRHRLGASGLRVRRLAPAVLLAALALAGSAAAQEGRSWALLGSARLNQVYQGSVADFETVNAGVLAIRLSAPRFEIRLREHELKLSPRPDGSHDFDLSVDFEGEGLLLAELDLVGFPSAMEDEVKLPRQAKGMLGRLLVEPGAEGYWITLLEAPSHLELAVESRLGADLVDWCSGVPFLSAGCEGLGRAFSSLRLPLPAAGSRHLLAFELLSQEERDQIDAYLAAAPAGR